MQSIGTWIRAVAVTLVVATSGAPAGASDATFSARTGLTSTGVDPDASGRTRFLVRGVHGRFDVRARRVAPDASFEVVVRGVRVGELRTSGGGNGRVRFRTAPRSDRDQLLGFDPRGGTLALRDEDGDDVLEGDIPEDEGEADEIRCCLPHPEENGEHQVECEHVTPAECDAQHGVNLGPGSCLPDPCAETPPPGEETVRCCVPDGDADDQAECAQLTAEQCSMEHGVNLGAGACDPNPCEPHPHPDEIRCCEPDDEGPECEHRTPEECELHGGVNMGAGMCELHLCDGTPVPDLIRCCEHGDSGTECALETPADCEAHAGVNRGSGMCEEGLCDVPPPDETRCCITYELHTECEHLTAQQCHEHQGVDVGAGLCEPDPCGGEG